ncbi:MAG: S8 family serine peptidase, partial [Candidatus Cloacimonetes bacterium]|nr:S8 family serine peptidase [Candidatus Cloacimonadota bacterium]
MFLKKKFYGFVLLVILLSFSSLFANSIQGQAARGEDFASDRILIKFTENVIDQVSIENERQINVEEIDQLNVQYNVRSVEKAYIEVNNKQMDEQFGIFRWYVFKYESPIDVELLISQLKELPYIEEAIPDYIAYPAAVPNDPIYSSQWGHNNTSQMLSYNTSSGSHNGPTVGTVGFDTNAEFGWDGSQGYGSSSVIIAIIDSGVDAAHADLNQVAGYDYGDNDSNPDDNSASAGHGTACAGVAAGIANNNLGVAGIAGGCSIMPLKVADSSGSMYFSAIDNAIYFAANNSADIASLSLGASLDPSAVPSTETALQYAVNAGVTIFAATANDNASSIDYPSNSQYVISVGAAAPDDGRKRSSSNSGQVNPGVSTDPNGVSVDNEVWWGSNYGSTTQDARDAVDVIAPTILPTTDISGSSGYSSTDYSMWFNGTSCATPYAAGVAALIKSQNPTWTPAQVKTQLTGTAIDVVNVESATGWDRYSGYGLVDAAAALYNPTVTVTSPNGGESWDLGTSHNITWTSQDITNIAIDLYNSGTYVYTIIGSYAASSGSMTWPIPTGLSASSSYSIRISDASDATTYDDSDAYFTLSNPGSPNPVIGVTPLSFTATVEMDGTDTQQMHITNNGDPGSTLTYSLSHGFTDADNIAGSYVACSPGTFTPGETTNWTLSVYNASSDAEWLSDVYVTFPLGVTVNSGADFVGGSGGNLVYDGSSGNGTTIHWYDAGGGWGNIYGGETATANINVTIHSGFIGDISLAYQIDGDVYGSTPHTVTGTAVVTQLITETWLSYTPTTGSCAQGITDDIDVTFDATGLTAG